MRLACLGLGDNWSPREKHTSPGAPSPGCGRSRSQGFESSVEGEVFGERAPESHGPGTTGKQAQTLTHRCAHHTHALELWSSHWGHLGTGI